MEATSQSRYRAHVAPTSSGPIESTDSLGGQVDPHAGTPLALFTTLARTALFLDALQDECLAPFGISFGDYAVLRLLEDPPEGVPLSPTRLAEMVVRTTGGMTKSLDRLERQGLVRRRRDPADGRGVLVSLTPKGRRVAEEASAAYVVGRQRVLDHLDEGEAEEIDLALRRLLAVFEREREADT
jgi:DNA-binding MarR family transcriptional regulator